MSESFELSGEPSGVFPVKKCRSCAEDVVWLRVTGKDKPQIFNTKPITVAVPVNAGVFAYVKGCYLSHFATCADADEWRKQKGNR